MEKNSQGLPTTKSESGKLNNKQKFEAGHRFRTIMGTYKYLFEQNVGNYLAVDFKGRWELESFIHGITDTAFHVSHKTILGICSYIVLFSDIEFLD